MRDSWLAPHRDFDSQAFLERVKSPRLRDMPALALWVPDAARAYNIREEWLLAVIEKEQTGVRARTLSRHAQDWLCGFGYTEGPKLTQFKGARNQVYSCARGLRRYLTPGDSLYVGGWVGKPRTFDGETRVVGSLVEAVCLQYTPHWSTLQTMERLWREFGFEDGDAAMPTTEDVARIARKVCAKFATGYRSVMKIGQISFELSDVARCSEFVRECVEAAAGTASHGPLTTRYFGGSARETETKLRARGTSVFEKSAVPGDIVCFNKGTAAGEFGHIGIHLSPDTFAENTSSAGRGPGFVISRYDQIGRDRISGYYHLPEFERAQPAGYITIVEGFGPEPLRVVCDARARVEEGVLRADVRALLEALGYRVDATHLVDQAKLYIGKED